MEIGFIGLGRMGYNMCLNLLEHKHKLVVYDVNPKPGKKLSTKGATAVHSINDVIKKLPKSKIIWIMVPSQFVDNVLKELTPLLKKGDIVIDGGNSFFKESKRRYNRLKRKGINYLDCGTSGGMSGARHGACMMIGGNRPIFSKVEKIFKDQCVKDGYGYMGESGMGHYVKMIHNGIEYGMMGAIAEGFETIKKHNKKTNLQEVAKVYAHGSIIESNLMTWLLQAYKKKGYLDSISCKIPKGETEHEMEYIIKSSNVPVLKSAVKMRKDTRTHKFCGKLISALRNVFGGHATIKR